MKLFAAMLTIVFGVASQTAMARDYHYGAVSNPDLMKCDALQWRGEIDAARQCYQTLSTSAADPANKAEAWWALGDAKRANEFFKTASKQQPSNSMILTRWGDLFTATHQYAEAQKLYSEALALDNQNVWADLGTGIVLSNSHDPAGKLYLSALLEQEDLPNGVRLKAQLVAALSAIEAEELKIAEDLLQQAESVANDHDLPQAEVYALKAALALRAGEPHQPWIDKSLADNPAYGNAYAIPAHIYMITFRYDETGQLYQKAVDVQPDHWTAHLELGANHLRQNRGKAAREHYEIAYSGDPFNPAIVNSLRMMDTYDTFEVLSFPENPGEKKLPIVSLRLDSKEADVLAPYVARLSQQAIATLSERYQYTLSNTATVEVYPNHEDFIVRTLGMPGMALLGVAFGDVVAMDSPTAQAGNDYHWGTTLWHEIAHIFTLKASGHNVPRWFTEGISVFEEWRTGPLPGIRIPNHVWQSLGEHEFLPIAELDSGFIRPEYDNQVIVSYMQGGLICEFLETQYSFDKLLGILTAYRDGLNTSQAIEKVMQMSTEQFDKEFQEFYAANFAKFAEQLPEFNELRSGAEKLIQEEQWQEAEKLADQAIAMMPNYVAADSPYLTKALAQNNQDQIDQEIATLKTFWQRGGYQKAPLLRLAEHMLEQEQTTEAAAVLQAYNLVDPFNLEVHQLLGDTLILQGNAADALVEYEVALALKPLDKAAAWYRVAKANQQLGNLEPARRQVLQALDVAPHFRPAQKLLRTLLSSGTTQE